MKRSTMAGVGAIALSALTAVMLSTSTETEGPTLSYSLTNFQKVAQVNPALRTTGDIVFVRGDELHVSTNGFAGLSGVICTNALVLRWPGVVDKCYDVEWTTDFQHWTNSRAWRVGTDAEIQFLTPVDLPQCFFRLRMVDCTVLTNGPAIPPPPPMPKTPLSGYAMK